MEIAIFGGTFDPPTLAHEAMIGAALMRPDIDEVWVMPSGTRLDKQGMASDQDRLAMLELIKAQTFGNDPKLQIIDFELKLPRPTQTYLTLLALKQSFPNHHFRFVFGVDSYLDMPKWDYGEQLREELDVLLVEREGYQRPPKTDKIDYLDAAAATEMALSSTEVRRNLALGKCISGMVSPAIGQLLQRECLYSPVQ